MALDLGPGQGYLVGAIVIGIVLLVAGMFGFALGLLGQILTVVAVILVIAWALKLTGLL
jgi:hypothetical protein